MKKILSVLLVLSAITATAEDSYLYWMLGDDASAFTYNTVKVSPTGGVGNDGYLTIYNSYGAELPDTGNANIVNAYSSLDQGLYASLAGLSDSSTFVIELWNDGVFKAQSRPLDWSTAMRDYVTTFNSMQLPSAWVASGFAIPEPNSGLLMLIGCAVLGLRRRRQRKV